MAGRPLRRARMLNNPARFLTPQTEPKYHPRRMGDTRPRTRVVRGPEYLAAAIAHLNSLAGVLDDAFIHLEHRRLDGESLELPRDLLLMMQQFADDSGVLAAKLSQYA